MKLKMRKLLEKIIAKTLITIALDISDDNFIWITYDKYKEVFNSILNNINNTEIELNIEKKETPDFDDEYDNDKSVNNNSIENNNDEINTNNRYENKDSLYIEDIEKLETDNDLYELNINNMSLLDRLLLKDDFKKELKKVITNIKNHKPKKRSKVSCESDDEKDMKNLDEKARKVKFRYPKK